MELSTKRLTARHIEACDWKSIRDIWKSFNASGYSCYDKPHPTDDETVRARIAKWAEMRDSTEHLFFAVCLNDRVIGYAAFNIRENGYEVGYCFHSDYCRRGYAKESLSALLDYLKDLGITRFTAGTALNNTPSVALLQSLGFRQIGTEKVSFYQDAHGNDIWFDGGIFELTAAEQQDEERYKTTGR